jgi:uncharacterized protein YkwD
MWRTWGCRLERHAPNEEIAIRPVMRSRGRGRIRATVIVGIVLTLPAGAAASVASAAAHARRSLPRRHKAPAKHRPTVFGVSMSAPVAGHPAAHPAGTTAAHPAAPGAAHPALTTAAHPALTTAAHPALTTAAHPAVTPVTPAGAHAGQYTAADTAGPAAGCANAGLAPSTSNVAAIAAATVCLVNGARQAAGLATLGENADLDQAAAAHADAMVADDYFDHVGPDGLSIGQRIRATGYVPEAAGGQIGENIAAATGSAATPAATVAAWMRSAAHRANILNPKFTATGLGVTRGVPRLLGTRAGGTYTEDFA